MRATDCSERARLVMAPNRNLLAEIEMMKNEIEFSPPANCKATHKGGAHAHGGHPTDLCIDPCGTLARGSVLCISISSSQSSLAFACPARMPALAFAWHRPTAAARRPRHAPPLPEGRGSSRGLCQSCLAPSPPPPLHTNMSALPLTTAPPPPPLRPIARGS